MFDLEKGRIRVIGHNVLLVRDAQPEDDGLIVIPEELRKYTAFGTVIQIGECVTKVKINDRVMFHKNYTYLPFEQRRVAITQEDKLIGIVIVRDGKESLIPLGSYILIKPEPCKKIVGMIELPNDGDRAFGGIVLEVGPDCLEIKPGARAFYNHGLAIECKLGADTLHIITEEHILCQIKKN